MMEVLKNGVIQEEEAGQEALEEQLQNSERARVKLQREQARLKGELKAIADKLKLAIQACDTLNNEKDVLEVEIHKLKKQFNDKFNDKLEALLEQVKEKKAELKTLTRSTERDKQRLEELKSRKNALKKELRVREQELGQLRAELVRVKQQKEAQSQHSQEQYVMLKQNMLIKVEQMKDEVVEYKSKYESLKASSEERETDHNKKVDELQVKLKDIRMKMERMVDEIDNLKDDEKRLKGECGSHQCNLVELKQQVVEVQSVLREREKETHNWQQKHDRKHSETVKLSAQRDQMICDNEKLKLRNAELVGEVELYKGHSVELQQLKQLKVAILEELEEVKERFVVSQHETSKYLSEKEEALMESERVRKDAERVRTKFEETRQESEKTRTDSEQVRSELEEIMERKKHENEEMVDALKRVKEGRVLVEEEYSVYKASMAKELESVHQEKVVAVREKHKTEREKERLELEKGKAQEERDVALVERNRATDEKVRAEEARGVAEEEKARAEERRRLAERERTQAEEERVVAEEKIAAAEVAKLQSEEARMRAEEEKANAEEKRRLAERGRTQAEQERVVAEGKLEVETKAKLQAEEEKIKSDTDRLRVEQERYSVTEERNIIKFKLMKLEEEKIKAEEELVEYREECESELQRLKAQHSELKTELHGAKELANAASVVGGAHKTKVVEQAYQTLIDKFDKMRREFQALKLHVLEGCPGGPTAVAELSVEAVHDDYAQVMKEKVKLEQDMDEMKINKQHMETRLQDQFKQFRKEQEQFEEKIASSERLVESVRRSKEKVVKEMEKQGEEMGRKLQQMREDAARKVIDKAEEREEILDQITGGEHRVTGLRGDLRVKDEEKDLLKLKVNHLAQECKLYERHIADLEGQVEIQRSQLQDAMSEQRETITVLAEMKVEQDVNKLELRGEMGQLEGEVMKIGEQIEARRVTGLGVTGPVGIGSGVKGPGEMGSQVRGPGGMSSCVTGPGRMGSGVTGSGRLGSRVIQSGGMRSKLMGADLSSVGMDSGFGPEMTSGGMDFHSKAICSETGSRLRSGISRSDVRLGVDGGSTVNRHMPDVGLTASKARAGLKSVLRQRYTPSSLMDGSVSVPGPVSYGSTFTDTDKVKSDLGPDEDGHKALEIKHFNMIEEIMQLKRTLEEKTESYEKNIQSLRQELQMERSRQGVGPGSSSRTPTFRVSVLAAGEDLSVKEKLLGLLESNNELQKEKDSLQGSLKKQEDLVRRFLKSLKDGGEEGKVRLAVGASELITDLVRRQVIMLQDQRDVLRQKLDDEREKNLEINELKDENYELSDKLRKERSGLRQKWHEKELAEVEVVRLQLALQKQVREFHQLEDLVRMKQEVGWQIDRARAVLAAQTDAMPDPATNTGIGAPQGPGYGSTSSLVSSTYSTNRSSTSLVPYQQRVTLLEQEMQRILTEIERKISTRESKPCIGVIPGQKCQADQCASSKNASLLPKERSPLMCGCVAEASSNACRYHEAVDRLRTELQRQEGGAGGGRGVLVGGRR